MDTIGEQVRRLRNSCTGPKPVHFFVKSCRRRGWRSARRGAAVVCARGAGACAGRTEARWLKPSTISIARGTALRCGLRRRQAMPPSSFSHCSAAPASTDSIPGKYRRGVSAAGARSCARRQAQGRRRCGPRAFGRVRRLCRRPEARPGRRHHLRRLWAEADAAVAAAALLTAASRAVAVRLCPRHGLDAPGLCAAAPGARQSCYTRRSAAPVARAQPGAGARASAGQAALHRRQCRAAAAVHVRRRQAGRFDGRGGRQAQMADADDRRLHPLSPALNPYWYVPPDLAGERRRPRSSSSRA